MSKARLVGGILITDRGDSPSASRGAKLRRKVAHAIDSRALSETLEDHPVNIWGRDDPAILTREYVYVRNIEGIIFPAGARRYPK